MYACQKFLEPPKVYSSFGTRTLCVFFLLLSSLTANVVYAQNDFVEPATPAIPNPPQEPATIESPTDPDTLSEVPVAVGEETAEVMETTDANAASETEMESAPVPAADTAKGYTFSEDFLKAYDGVEEEETPQSVGGECINLVSDAVRRMVMGLSVVLALILILYYLVRRFGKNVPALSGYSLGQVVGQVHLTRTATLHYVKSGGRILVIGVNDGGVNLVAEYDEATFANLPSGKTQPGDFDPETFVD